jgi:hypothetical protein
MLAHAYRHHVSHHRHATRRINKIKEREKKTPILHGGKKKRKRSVAQTKARLDKRINDRHY